MAKTDPQLTAAVIKYREQRAKIKSRQRQELEDELKPWASDVGTEINRVRREVGASIQDIADIIGIQNRTFIYKMINSVPSIDTPEPRQDAALFGAPVVVKNKDRETEYYIEYFDGAATVHFPNDESYDIVVIDGHPDLPEEWAEHSKERRGQYRYIAASIRNHYKGT